MTRSLWLACALLGVMGVLLVSSVWYKSLTYDERAHWDYGRRVLAMQTQRTKLMDDSKMPVSALNALPWLLLGRLGLQEALLPAYGELPPEQRAAAVRAKKKQLAVKTGRAATIVFALLSGLVVFFWSRELYGPDAALFSLALYVLSPNILAHGRFVTTDIFGMGCIALAGYAFWRYCVRPEWSRCFWAGASLGLAQIAKFSCVYLVPIDLLLLLPLLPELLRAIRTRKIRAAGTMAAHLLLFSLAALVVLNTGFLFQGTLRPLSSYSFESGAVRRLQSASGVLADVPLPLPAAFISGLDMVKAHEENGRSFGKLYLRGQLRDLSKGEGGFPGYYFWAVLYKFPLPLLLVVGWSLLSLCGSSGNTKLFWQREWFLLGPAAVYLTLLNCVNNAQIGVRHLLVIFPFLLVFCGRLLQKNEAQPSPPSRIRIACLALLLGWQLVSVGSYFPHFVSYFNELSWDRSENWRLLSDSNLEWGQNERYVERFFRKHPDAHLNPVQPCCGLVLVDSNKLTGVLAPESDYAWLRNKYRPAGHVAYGFVLYDIPQSDCAGDQKQ